MHLYRLERLDDRRPPPLAGRPFDGQHVVGEDLAEPQVGRGRLGLLLREGGRVDLQAGAVQLLLVILGPGTYSHNQAEQGEVAGQCYLIAVLLI